MSGLRISFFALLTFFFTLPAGKLLAQHPVWHNYTINNGLTSNEVYAMIQDSRGYLWFGTNQGICRFNGYEFTRPVDTSAAASSEALHIVEDAQGHIWFNRIDGTLWIIENDSVRSWPHNQRLKPLFKKFQSNHRFAVEKDGTVWVSSWRNGILIVQPNGSDRIITGQNRNAYLFSEIDSQIILANEIDQHADADYDFKKRRGQSDEVLRWQEGKTVSLGRFPLDYSADGNGVPGLGMWSLRNGDYIGRLLQTYYLIRGNQLLWHGQKDGTANAIIEDADGGILMAVNSGKNQGLLRFRSLESFKHNEYENLLPGKLVTQVIRDREGGWWAATVKSGIFYCKNPHLGFFDHTNGLPADEVNTLTSDGRENIYAGLHQLDIIVFQRNGGIPKMLPRPPIAEMQVLRFDTLTGRLWAANQLCYLEKNRWTFAKWLNPRSLSEKRIPVKKISSEPSGIRWWASSHADIFSIDPKAGTGNRILLDTFLITRTFSVSFDLEDNLWITSMEGLRFWRDGHFVPPFFNHPALRFNARNVELLPQTVGGGQVIALLGGGLLIRDQKGRFVHLTTQDGLSSNEIGELDISPEGVIYACSNAGLNILKRQTNGQWHIETLTIKHGLPSNQVNDVVLLGGEAWIATDGGLVRFRGKPAPAPMPAPMLEKFVVNNHPLIFPSNLQLPHVQNNLSLRFFSLHFRSSGDIPYRYRLLGADTAFVYTHTREVNFANLSPARYTFEVQAQNEDGKWSESARWAFTILPPWWATWWFRALVGATLVVALYLFYQNRLKAIRREAAERGKIRDLESAALRAQMNPHFIFNCLQAIQSFIAQNDRDAAATYLARFAKLVRLALHGSVDGLHTLAEEISMLDNYLHLEQLRFQGKFEFSVRAAEGLDAAEISLPPLLVQPFVENALIHGLQGRESGGFVEVVFASKGRLLQVTVSDNGLGFSEKNNAEKAAHKSVGMMLTQKRLDLLVGGGKDGSEHFVRETVLNEKGTAVGARVQILIPI